jgi:hypothetical protein
MMSSDIASMFHVGAAGHLGLETNELDNQFSFIGIMKDDLFLTSWLLLAYASLYMLNDTSKC